MPRPKLLAILLAGGQGSRMKALTAARAKPALPFAGVYHLIDFPLSNCVHSGVADVWVVEQFQPHALNEHLLNGRPWDLDRNTGGLRILPPYTGGSESGWAAGNADALYRNRRFIREFAPDLLLVLSADHIYTLDYRDVIDAHLRFAERGAAVTMVTTEVPVEEAGRFGTVRVDDDGRVTSFEYKPEHPTSGTVTTEVFVYDAGALLDTLDTLGEGEGDEDDEDGEPKLKDFGHELLPSLVREGRAYAFPLPGYWRDVGTLDSYWEGHMDLLRLGSALTLDDPAWPILTNAAQHPPARVAASARVDNGMISSGCDVRGAVIESVLAPGVVVEEGATVTHAVLLGNVVVRAGATVAHAIVDREVEVGADARVGDIDAGAGGGRPELAIVGQRARVEAGARVPPGACVDPDLTPRADGAARGRIER
jgi:glucose-1-phosphate adenylyltransferase